MLTIIPGLPETVILGLSPRWAAGSGVSTEVRMGWSPDVLRVSFQVREPQIRSLETDPWLVHRDSCVELFFSAAEIDGYINIEANPSGVKLIASGRSRKDRTDLTSTAGEWLNLSGSHLGRGPFEDSQGGTWIMDFDILPELAGCSRWLPGTGLQMNLYKCGDGLVNPHYLSWQPIDAAQPDFHRPESFSEVYLRG